jgi:mannosyltransferase
MSTASGPAVPAGADETGTTRWRWVLAFLVVLAAALRLHGLGSQLWLDEMDAVLESIRRPAADIVTRWPATTSHVLYDLCSHASVRALGETALAVRLPAALFGVGGVIALLLFTEPVLGRRVAAVAAALMAVSYHHVFYSQNARGYTALLFFALLASRGLLRFRARRAGRAAWAGYVFACALAAYSLVLGVFVVAGHALLVAASALTARRRGHRPAIPVRRYAAAAATAGALIVLLYAPFAPHLLRFTQRQARLPAAAESAHGGAAARLGVAADAIEGLGRGLGGRAGLAVAALAAAIGGALWARRDGLSLAVLVVPVVLELAALLAADVPLSPRYFALALAPLTIALAVGLVAIADRIAGTLETPRARMAADTLLAGVVMAAALPLASYYRVPKQDFQGAMDRVAVLAGDGDGRIAVHYAARGICGFYRAGFQDVQALADLEAQEKKGRRLWVVTTLERFLAAEAPALHAHIQSSYRRVAVLPGTVGGAEMNIYERKEARF